MSNKELLTHITSKEVLNPWWSPAPAMSWLDWLQHDNRKKSSRIWVFKVLNIYLRACAEDDATTDMEENTCH